MEHTKTPWCVSSGVLVCTPKAEILANLMPFGVPGIEIGLEEAIENADFIVRACNCHDELLAACKALVACCIVAKHPEDKKPFYESQNLAKAAIAKATGTV